MTSQHQAIIIGGGQAGLATTFYLRRAGIECVILDNQVGPGGSWRGVWEDMVLFSDASYSSLPGMQMKNTPPPLHPKHVVDYFTAYEDRYGFDVRRPVVVDKVRVNGRGSFTVTTDGDSLDGENVVMATGIQQAPFVPHYPGSFTGLSWHTANYPGKEPFAGRKVAVIGAGNSGAQIASELSEIADVEWLVRGEPNFMPDSVTGTDLFTTSRARALAILRGERELPPSVSDYGDIIVTEVVRRARDEGRLRWQQVPDSLDELEERGVEHLIWATGFRPALRPVRDLIDDNLQTTVDNLHLLGYGDWTGPGSATITGVGIFAKQVARAIGQRYGHEVK